MKPIFDWSRVMFIAQGKKPWTREDAAKLAMRVEALYLEERERDRSPVRVKPELRLLDTLSDKA